MEEAERKSKSTVCIIAVYILFLLGLRACDPLTFRSGNANDVKKPGKMGAVKKGKKGEKVGSVKLVVLAGKNLHREDWVCDVFDSPFVLGWLLCLLPR